MEDIKFIKKITDYIELERTVVGNCIYYNLDNGNKVKLWCYELGVEANVINKANGKIDAVSFPFVNYFKPTRCSDNAPQWTQYIYDNKWNFEDLYPHTIPKEYDYKNLAKALITYIEMYA